MTRRNILILVTVLVTVFTFGPISPVGACELDTNDRCMQMGPAERAAMFRAASAPAPLVDAHGGLTLLQRVCTYSAVDFPTCYTLQADGMWAREELAAN
jgi:hypothetical protein